MQPRDPNTAGPVSPSAVRVAGAVAALIGGYWLAIWFSGGAPERVAAGIIIPKTNMALCQLLGGVALLLLAEAAPASLRSRTGTALAALVFLVGVLTLAEHLTRLGLGIDQLLATELPGAAATASPNRMGPPGSLSLTLLGAALVMSTRQRRSAVPYLGLLVCLIDMVPLIGYLYGAEELFAAPRLTGIAVYSVAALTTLGIGTILLVGESGPMELLLRQDPGGALLRRMLPLVALIPLLVGFLKVRGQLLGLYDSPMGTAMLVIALIMLFSLFLWRSALRLSQSSAAEAGAGRALASSEARLRQLNEELELRVAAQTEEIRQANTTLEERIALRTAQLQTANESLRRSRLAALNLMDDAVAARRRAEETNTALQQEVLERKRIEQERQRLTDELEQRVADRTRELAAANKELESFSYSVSHDLKAPLRAVTGFAGFLLNDKESSFSDQGRHYLETIIANAGNMTRLIDDILAFSRLSRQELAASTVDMEALARSVVNEQLAGREEAVDITIGELPPVRGDQPLLRQVMANLISNALKFSRNAERPGIEIGATRGDGEVVFYVRDNGVGFDMKYAPRLFGVFQRLHDARQYEGTGVGLAFSKRIIERHGGRIWAEGKVNEGATFFFTLPGG